MHLIYRKTCRVCGSSALTPVIDLGEQYLQGSFVKPSKEIPPVRKIPLRVLRCDPTRDEKACGLLQMEHTVPPEVLYAAYWYRSGTNNTMHHHLESLAHEAAGILGGGENVVLDIGCNDGTLLKSFPPSYLRIGIDPSDVAHEVGDGITVVRDLFPSTELSGLLDGRKVDIITSIAMFYDLEDPVSFVQEIKRLLSPRGVWIFEMSYMPSMLAMNAYDTICHEHLEYYSFTVIENILRAAGLKAFRVALNDINGGSLRCFATHEANFQYKRAEHVVEMKQLRQREFDLELDTDKPYAAFQQRINVHRDELTKLLRGLKREGKRIHIYGASTKGNTILQWCGIDNRIIDFAAERNPDKFGASTLGTDIPIISEAESRAMKPDYYLVLPWHFRPEFMEREREMLAAGGRFIFPLPKLDVVHA